MSIYRIDNNLPLSTKITLLNKMIMELNGLIAHANFNQNEIEYIYDVLGSGNPSIYSRDVGLGNTVGTYTGWTHVQAESGYSIWKYTPANYAYSALNNLYFDGMLFENNGEATSESSSSFAGVYLFTGSSYVDNTTEAGTEGGSAFTLMEATDDYIYIGDAATFSGASFEFLVRGSNNTLKVEYYNGAWTELLTTTNSLVDNTSNLQSDGTITWAVPGDWAQTDVNSSTKYWVRLSTTTTPVTGASATRIIPTSSVIGLLALSSAQIFAEEWAWCTYNSVVYVTIRNTGVTSSEGDYFINSSSSSTNKENYFVYNHSFTADYLKG